MTRKKTNNITPVTATENFHKLSIQVNLNGLSFCVLDTISNKVLQAESLVFDKEETPYILENRLKGFLSKHGVDRGQFSEVIVIHRNATFGIVPKSLFDKDQLADYLKFNTKILANDHIVHDEIPNHDLINVYVPFTNINNYIFDLYGEFEFQHNATLIVNALLNTNGGGKNPTCYVNMGLQQMDVTIIQNKRLLFFNSFEFNSKEDFIYYLLFTLEQLQLNPQNLALKLFGAIEEDDEIYALCYRYVKNVSIFIPPASSYPILDLGETSFDFSMLSTL